MTWRDYLDWTLEIKTGQSADLSIGFQISYQHGGKGKFKDFYGCVELLFIHIDFHFFNTKFYRDRKE